MGGLAASGSPIGVGPHLQRRPRRLGHPQHLMQAPRQTPRSCCELSRTEPAGSRGISRDSAGFCHPPAATLRLTAQSPKPRMASKPHHKTRMAGPVQFKSSAGSAWPRQLSNSKPDKRKEPKYSLSSAAFWHSRILLPPTTLATSTRCVHKFPAGAAALPSSLIANDTRNLDHECLTSPQRVKRWLVLSKQSLPLKRYAIPNSP